MSDQEPAWRPMTTAAATSTSAAGVEDAPTEQMLYEVRRKIYPRAVTGAFARWRVWLVLATQLVFYGLPWLQWNGRQAVLFDLGARKFYLFGLVLWPQDVIYLTLLLVLSALGLFCLRQWRGDSSAAMPVRKRSTRKSSCGSSGILKATALPASAWTVSAGACASCA